MPANPKAERNLCRPSTSGPCVTAVVSLATTLIFALSRLAGATTVNAHSSAQSDVAAAIASAADGDTVTIPGGTASWTRTLAVKKGITIQGSGVGVTIIKDNVASGQLISMTVPAGLTSRVTGIEFQDGGHGGRGGYANNPGLVNAQCADQRNGAQFRFDHNKWNDVFGDVGVDTILGVADHNTFISNGRGSFSIYANHYDGQPNGYDYSWHDPCNFGSANFFFIEDNTFTNTNATNQAFITDAVAGARFVIRHNTSTGYRTGDHGTDSVGRQRGSRCYEVYNNTMDGANLNKYIGGSRSSTVLMHDNNISNYWSPAQFSLDAFRTFYRFPIFGGADGTNPWDVNSPTAFYTGTVASRTSGGGSPTVTVTGTPNWRTNQWYGYVLRRLTDNCNSSTINYAEIASNTSNVITYGYAQYAPSMSFCVGDSLEIRKVNQAMDVSGRGQGGILSNVLNATPPPTWNDQVTEPSYMWNNGPETTIFAPSTGTIRAGEHYFNNTPMPGYTPYTYPHPLTKGLPPPEQTTQNATANSQDNGHKKRRAWGGRKPEGKKAKKAKESPTNEMPEGQENVDN